MSESSASTTVLEPLATPELEQLLARLALPSPAVDDAARIDRIRALEQIKNAACAAQAHESVTFAESQLAAQEAAGVPAHRRGRGIADQVALARMASPHQGSRHLGLARTLVNGELPNCLAALERGEVSEWRITCIARETAHLEAPDRRRVDAELAPRLGEMGIGPRPEPRGPSPSASTPPQRPNVPDRPRPSAASRSGPPPTP